MTSEINQSGFGNAAFQNVSDSTINYSQQIVVKSPEYAELLDQQKQLEKYLNLLPETEEEERRDTSAKIFALRERIENFKSDVLKLAESFSRIEINTDRLRRAKEHFDKGEITEARIVLEDALEEMADEKNYLLAEKKKYVEDTVPKLRSKADEYLILAQTTALNYENPNHFDDAKKYFKASIECLASGENLLIYARFLYRAGERRSSIEICTAALGIARRTSDVKEEGVCLGLLGAIHDAFREYEKAIEFHLQALDLARSSENLRGEAWALHNLGVTNLNMKDYSQAMKYLSLALQTEESVDDYTIKVSILISLGTVFERQENYESALDHCNKGLEIARANSDRYYEAQALGHIALIYYVMQKFEKAIAHAELELRISREIHSRGREANALVILGFASDELADHKRAIECYETSLPILHDLEDFVQENYIFGRLAETYFFQHDLRKAKQYYKLHLEGLVLEDALKRGITFYKLGSISAKLNELDDARGYFRCALFIFKDSNPILETRIRKYIESPQLLQGH